MRAVLLVLALLVGGIILAVTRFGTLSWSDMGSNIAAELVGVGLTVFVIDRLLSHQRNGQATEIVGAMLGRIVGSVVVPILQLSDPGNEESLDDPAPVARNAPRLRSALTRLRAEAPYIAAMLRAEDAARIQDLATRIEGALVRLETDDDIGLNHSARCGLLLAIWTGAREVFYRYCGKDPVVRRHIADCDEALIDFMERGGSMGVVAPWPRLETDLPFWRRWMQKV
jgi:hypothetical protein